MRICWGPLRTSCIDLLGISKTKVTCQLSPWGTWPAAVLAHSGSAPKPVISSTVNSDGRNRTPPASMAVTSMITRTRCPPVAVGAASAAVDAGGLQGTDSKGMIPCIRANPPFMDSTAPNGVAGGGGGLRWRAAPSPATAEATTATGTKLKIVRRVGRLRSLGFASTVWLARRLLMGSWCLRDHGETLCQGSGMLDE